MRNINTVICLVLLLIFVKDALAGCKTDCKDEYESEVEDCHLIFYDSDSHEELLSCIEDAKSELEDCKYECES